MCFGRHLKNGHHSHNFLCVSLKSIGQQIKILRALTTYLGRMPGISISPTPLCGGQLGLYSNLLKFIPETHRARLCFYLHCTIFIADNQNREGDVKQPSWRECHYFKHRFTCPDHLPQSQQGYRLQSPSYHHDPFT